MAKKIITGFKQTMQVHSQTSNSKVNFKSFYNRSAWLEDKALINRGAVVAINDVAWIGMANNNAERKEKARRSGYFFFMSFMTPLLMLPFMNRAAMKGFSKLTKSYWSKEHKLIHISNEHLQSTEAFKKGMEELSTNYSHSPWEKLYYKIKGKKVPNEPLNFDPLLEKCGGKTDEGYEKLRKKIINTKTGILFTDFLLTSLATGLSGYINNSITKKLTGQTGFSAEFKMADKKVIEERGKKYEQTRKKKLAAFLIATLAATATVPLLLRKGLNGKSTDTVSKFMKKYCKGFDYDDGIYMKRLSLLFGSCLMSQVGTMIFSRNKTELKDSCIRYPITDVIFFGGDIMMASLLAGACDKLFKTQLAKPAQNKFQRFFPKFKSLKELNAEVAANKISKSNKNIGLALYWTTFAATTAAIGFAVPALINRIIKKDVNKDVEKTSNTNNSTSLSFNNNPAFKNFIKIN